MSRDPTTAEKLRGLPWLTTYGSLNVVFCHLTVFGSSFILFLSYLGFDKTKIGALMSLMPFCGLLAPLVAPRVARIGYKRSFLTFWGMRNVFTSLLLLIPVLLGAFGRETTFYFMAAVLLGFALCRSVGEVSYYPWYQEIVPRSIRGKYLAVNYSMQALISFVAVAFASYVLGRSPESGQFLWLIGIGVVFGVASLVCMSLVPGGRAIQDRTADRAELRGMLGALKDRNFRNYLLGIAMVLLALRPIESFIQLFMKEQVGLNPGQIVMLQNASLLGGLLSCFLWGWAGDRYGSKPVLLASLACTLGLPLGWLAMPRHSAASMYVALAIGALWGFLSLGYYIGADRQLFVNVVPQEKKASYLAVYYAWVGLFGGLGPLLAGRALDLTHDLHGSVLMLPIDPYTPLFLWTCALLLAGILLLRRMKSQGEIPAAEFAGMFLRGNPLRALEAMIRYNLASDEPERIENTARLGRTGSPLNVDELLQALTDPSFNVRYEAVISIGRTRQDERLTEALIQVLTEGEPDLSVTAATSLGRLGDVTAIPALRRTLNSPYPVLRARSARALAALCDEQAVPLLRDLFVRETDPSVRLAYASALAALQATDVISEMLSFLETVEGRTAQAELAFALARLVGGERYFMRLWRKGSLGLGTAASQAVASARKKLRKLPAADDRVLALADKCAEALAEDRIDQGAPLLGQLVASVKLDGLSKSAAAILRHCATMLPSHGAARTEYLLLALHTLNTALAQAAKAARISKTDL